MTRNGFNFQTYKPQARVSMGKIVSHRLGVWFGLKRRDTPSCDKGLPLGPLGVLHLSLKSLSNSHRCRRVVERFPLTSFRLRLVPVRFPGSVPLLVGDVPSSRSLLYPVSFLLTTSVLRYLLDDNRASPDPTRTPLSEDKNFHDNMFGVD